MKKKIGLVYDLRKDYMSEGYSEEQVVEFDSEETIEVLKDTLCALGYETERIGNGRALCRRLVGGDCWDLVFNISKSQHGRSREAQVPSLLEMYGIRYTFSDPLICAITLDKGFAKRIVRDSGLPTAKFKVVKSSEDIRRISLEYPLFAKPIAEGAGKGINHNSRIESHDSLMNTCEYLLDRFAQPVLVEEFLPGREFTVGILGNGSDANVLGIIELKIPQDTKNAIDSYVAKERHEGLVDYLPYRKGLLHRHLEQLALKSYKVLQCRDAACVAIRCDRKEVPCFSRIDPLPGLHPNQSDLPMMATQEGMSYTELIETIIKNAFLRQEIGHEAISRKSTCSSSHSQRREELCEEPFLDRKRHRG